MRNQNLSISQAKEYLMNKPFNSSNPAAPAVVANTSKPPEPPKHEAPKPEPPKTEPPNPIVNKSLIEWTDFKLNEDFVKKQCNSSLTILKDLNMSQVQGQPEIEQLVLRTCVADQAISTSVAKTGSWEKDIQTILFKDVLPMFPKEVAIIDVGAHIGTYSLPIAALGRRVYSFEPDRQAFELLRHATALNNLTSNIKLFNYGLMEAVDNVNVAKLDDLVPILQKDKVRQALMKVDVGGAEDKVILGAGNLFTNGTNITHIPLIQMEIGKIKEIHASGPEEEKKIVTRFLEMMKYLGFKISPVTPPVDWQKNQLSFDNFKDWPNVVFFHNIKR